MRKSIKKMVFYRVAAALLSIMLFSGVTTYNLIRVEGMQKENESVVALLSRAQAAEAAHYKWSSNLSNALYAGTEFTGSKDPTTCVLGKWIYGEAGTDDAEILRLRSEMEPLHKALHESADYVLDLMASSPSQARSYYQETIQANLTTLVGKLDDVIALGTALNEASTEEMNSTIMLMQGITAVCLVLALVCLISLVLYVLKHILAPILHITRQVEPLHDGTLDLALEHHSNDELGDLATTLEKAMELIRGYIWDLNRVMEQLAKGDFNVKTATPFIGDFRSIEQSIEVLTTGLSATISSICQAQGKVSGNAEHLSNGAQNLAQGATEQASAVQELYATLDTLSQSATENVKTAALAQDNARRTGEQVTISGQQMEQMVAAMKDITEASQQIEKIIATIEDIAFQTNILALNAAVEAARAGAAGKGFAVVADEVRNLASKSDEAAKATKGLIENSVQATSRGSRIVDEVSMTLNKTLELVVQSNTAIGAIVKAVESDAESIAQVTEGIGQISAVVQSNSASSEESAAVSAELFTQVQRMEEQTRRFKLKA
ncbi:MAG: HAMP domain-containing protein [Lawsonibacter sp.]|jgi:methyl-accepting chemotaxis protein|nr:HAMP domain-containing protein [Lawsonibacter sp.]MCI8989214.1 HAMP domain-containing protein [Lawsonibacter sp.]MCI9267227.1 HAMP domain-containing protein [Lawsonibacter sp.]